MKITAKEMGISGAIIVGSGLLIGAITMLWQKASASSKQANDGSNEKDASKPVCNMEVVFKGDPEQKTVKVSDTIIQKNDTAKEVTITKQILTKVEAPQIEEVEIEEVPVVAIETKEEVVPTLIMTNDDFPLGFGSKGARVFALQKYLLKNHGYGGAVTDQYDQNLADRVKKLLKVEQVDEFLFNKLMYKRKRRR